MEEFEFTGIDTASGRVHAVHQRYKKGKFKVIGVWEFHANKKEGADVRRSELYRSCCEYFAMLATISPGCQVFCEEPISGRNGKTNRILGLVAGAIWTAHLDFDLMWHWVDISHWKKVICGSGGAKKLQIQEWSLKHGGKKKWEEDHHDANGIGVAGALDLVAALESA